VASEKRGTGKVEDFNPGELNELYDTIALVAQVFILRVDPKKRMIFNPEESIDFHGFNGHHTIHSRAYQNPSCVRRALRRHH